MSKHDKTEVLRATDYFHAAPYNWNCAQSIFKSKQKITKLSDQEIEQSFRSMGGGRAEGGLCGALYAVKYILGPNTPLSQEAQRAFQEQAGAITCSELKGKCGKSCAELVNLAEDILDLISEHESAPKEDQEK